MIKITAINFSRTFLTFAKTFQGRIQRLKKGGGQIEKVRMRFATLETGELHNICFYVLL